MLSQLSTPSRNAIAAGHEIGVGVIDAVSDFRLDANFIGASDHILDAADLSLDRRLELIAGLLNRLEPALLQRATAWEDEEIARAFLEFAAPAGNVQETSQRAARLLNALAGAAIRSPDPSQARTRRRMMSG